MESAIVTGLHFSPHTEHQGARRKGCYTCEHWKGEFFSGRVMCERQARWPHIPGVPSRGCVHWMRAIGGDDE